MRSSQIPTIFYPNMNTGMDDQLARCKVAEKEGWGIVVEKRDAKSIPQAIQEIASFELSETTSFVKSVGMSWVADYLSK